MFSAYLHFLRHTLGVDRAIGATAATQLIRFITGPITMVLIIRYLSPVEQGYFYSFSGVMAIQVFLEAGFSVSISQFASKEYSGLRFTAKNILSGRSENLSRLRSIFQKANHYYCTMAAILAIGLIIGGYMFFSTNPSNGVPWKLPWIIVSICAGFSFLLTPFWAILEGCNRIPDIASYRFLVTVIGFIANALGLIICQNIWVTVWSSVATLIFAYAYLFWKWRRFAFQILRRYQIANQVHWFQEIWAFQWRIAGTWGARYFVEAGIPAIAFQFYGPVVAGQAGMSFQLTRMLGSIASSWTATKIPHWGLLVTRKQWAELSKSWKASAARHIAISFLSQIALWLLVATLFVLFPGKADRLLMPSIFAGFSIGWTLYSFWLISMHYTRSHRLEPFMFMHIAVAVAFIGLLLIGNQYLGVYALTYAFALVHLPTAIASIIIMERIRLEQEAYII